MVIEEAINELNFLKRVMLRKEEIEALDMAASILGAYRQIIWERDIAIQQLKDLGYKLGEKPKENKDDLISRQSLIEGFADMRDGYPIITNDQLTVKDVIEIILSMPSVSKREKTDAERIKQTLSELAQYNADMLKAFNAGKELAERETTYLDHYTKIKEWAKNNGFVLVTEEWYDKARVAYYWRYYGERSE